MYQQADGGSSNAPGSEAGYSDVAPEPEAKPAEDDVIDADFKSE